MSLGLSGRIARSFQASQMTPLLALVALLMGIFATLVTPREEEPQIDVTMANVIVPFDGAGVRDVEQWKPSCCGHTRCYRSGLPWWPEWRRTA